MLVQKIDLTRKYCITLDGRLIVIQCWAAFLLIVIIGRTDGQSMSLGQGLIFLTYQKLLVTSTMVLFGNGIGLACNVCFEEHAC